MATAVCGWELDDVVRWLQDEEGMFDRLKAVERTDEFAGSLEFADQSSAEALAVALRSGRVPAAMTEALALLEVTERIVQIRFRPVAEVALTARGPGHDAACVLDTLPAEMHS